MNKKWWKQCLLKILGTLNENVTDSHVSKYMAQFTGISLVVGLFLVFLFLVWYLLKENDCYLEGLLRK